jgi:two-component system sensor histidine kinase PhcS
MFRNYKTDNLNAVKKNAVEKAYKRYQANFHRKRLNLLILLSIFFISAFGFLDLVFYPAIFGKLITARFTTNIILVVMFVVVNKFYFADNVKLLSFVWNLLLMALISTLIFLTKEGESSTYYAGLSLTILASAILLPWTIYETSAISVAAVLFYLFTLIITHNYLYSKSEYDFVSLTNNLFFLVSSGFFCVLATYLNSDVYFKEFQLNYNLKMTNLQLIEAQAQLVQSEKINAMGNLAAGILHEINNPLNYAIAAVRIISTDDKVIEDANLKDTINDIEEGMMRIKNIVSDLHNFAHPQEADKQKHFMVADIIESALRFTASECKDIEKIIDVPKNLEVSASKAHIVQILINLISNASKAIRKVDNKKGIIKIWTEKKDKRIIIFISDNGIGMSDKTLAKVFDPFFTTSEVGKGMGMGLSVSYTIAKNHGGTLSATSELGKGSIFSFDLAA